MVLTTAFENAFYRLFNIISCKMTEFRKGLLLFSCNHFCTKMISMIRRNYFYDMAKMQIIFSSYICNCFYSVFSVNNDGRIFQFYLHLKHYILPFLFAGTFICINLELSCIARASSILITGFICRDPLYLIFTNFAASFANLCVFATITPTG